MYHRRRLNKTYRSIICTVLLTVCILTAALVSGFETKPKTDSAATFSFPASTQFIEQLDTQLSMRFFTLFPAQETTSMQETPLLLYPGGQPVGILLRTDGILVVGYSPIQTEQHQIHPAESAGIQAGDVILSVNDIQVMHDDDLAMLVNQLGMKGTD